MPGPEQNEQVNKTPGFVRRHWWGVTCFVVFIITFGLAMATMNKIEPSSSYGGIIFFARHSPEKSGHIIKPPANFQIMLISGENLLFKNHKRINNVTDKYPARHAGDRLTFSSLDFQVDGKVLADLFKKNGLPGIETEPTSERLEDGAVSYSAGYDVPMVVVRGLYLVQGNSITEHYFLRTDPWGVSFTLFTIPLLYIGGVIIRSIYRLVARRIGMNPNR